MELLHASSASAHGMTSTVFADVSSPQSQHVRVDLRLEYDLLIYSADEQRRDDAMFQAAKGAWDDGDLAAQAKAFDDHRDEILGYITPRFQVSADGASCAPTQVGGFTVAIEPSQEVPYAGVTLDYACPAKSTAHEITSRLFADSEGYVRGVRAIVTYDLDMRHGSTVLDGDHPTFSSQQSGLAWFWQFFKLGAHHLLTGLDHILFLCALIAGSRRLREIVLAATTFTVAHSITFIFAALGVVHVPADFVEPTIALSIAVVAAWYLWRIVRLGSRAMELDVAGKGHLALDRAGWLRLAVVFCFGLVHGLGFAGALGIDAAWSWTLLGSLLVFNIGIEAVQLGIIALVFPVLALLRRGSDPRRALWATGAICAVVTAMGLFWFVQRIVQGA